MKKVKFLEFLLIAICAVNLYAYDIFPSACEKKIDNSFDSTTQIINLEGNWEFYWDKTPSDVQSLLQNTSISSTKKQLFDSIIKIPGFWNSTVQEITGENLKYGKATYRLVVTNLIPNYTYSLGINESPGTSSDILVNGVSLCTTGDPYCKKNSRSHSVIRPVYVNFNTDENGNAEIMIFVNNYFYRIGGLWDTVRIGSTKMFFNYYSILNCFYLFTVGIMIFIAVLNLVQFLLDVSKRQYMYLFLIALACAARISVTGYNSLGVLFPNIPAEIKIKIEYLAIWLVPMALYSELLYLYPGTIKKVFKIIPVEIFRYAALAVLTVLGLTSLFAPARISNELVPYLEIMTGISALIVLVFIIANIIKKSKYIYFHLISVIALVAGLLLDTVFSKYKGIMQMSYVPVCLDLFVIIQLLMLSYIQTDLYKQSEAMANNLQLLNISYIRFVPYEFLKLLKKNSITGIELGDHTTVEMSILFSKISIFDVKHSKIPEKKIQYEIYSEFLKNISPCIGRNNGFISKFLSNGIMALFQDEASAVNSIKASLKIVDCLKDLNLVWNQKGYVIDIYIGLHYGTMILGTIGDANRLDDTVISDTVNTVSRIESVCERLNKKIIISEELLKNTTENLYKSLEINQLQSIPIKGKSKTLKLFECSANQEFVQEAVPEEKAEVIEDLEEVDELEEV